MSLSNRRARNLCSKDETAQAYESRSLEAEAANLRESPFYSTIPMQTALKPRTPYLPKAIDSETSALGPQESSRPLRVQGSRLRVQGLGFGGCKPDISYSLEFRATQAQRMLASLMPCHVAIEIFLCQFFCRRFVQGDSAPPQVQV